MIEKNQLIELRIDAVTSEGSGVGRYNGMAVFVPLTAPDETATIRIVKLQKSYCYGIVESLIHPSPERIDPDCEVFKRCGGCTLRHLSYRCELAQKQQWVVDAVRRLGGLELPVEDILPSPDEEGYRNKAQYPFGTDAQGKTVCGFFAPRSHVIIPTADCKLQPAFFGDICRTVCDYIDRAGGGVYNEATGVGLFRHLYIRYAQATGQVMVCLVINGQHITGQQELVTALQQAVPGLSSVQLNHNTRRTNVILGDKTTLLWGTPTITDQLCDLQVDISPLSFYQVNRRGAEQLYAVAGRLAQLQDGQLLLDLYCGAGTIGLCMVRQKPAVRLVGVDIVAAAIEDARHNATRAGMANARFIAADAGQAAQQLADEGLHPDVVVVDPPRKGCDDATLQAIAQMAPARLVMVSCNPATMARDLATLLKLGYCTRVVQPVDMFPRTSHVEAVALLERHPQQ